MKRGNSDLWIIGDSFAESNVDGNYWTDILMENFNGENRYLNACPGRDIQTIMDTFYKNIHNISDTSLVIIFLPTVARIRYPKKERYFNDYLETGWRKELEDKTQHNFKEYFLHSPTIGYENITPIKELEFPFDSFDYKKIDNTQLITYNYKNESDKIAEAINDISCLDFARLLNTNQATIHNWNDIFHSIKHAFPFKVLFFSWTDEYDIKSVFTKQLVTILNGYWHTNADEYKDTNGKSGNEIDEHFSLKMHAAFAKLIMDSNKTYFK